MKLYIMRHGRAGAARTDDERVLTDEGKSSVRRVAEALRERGVGEPTILSSPLARARETAEILAQVLGVSGIAVLAQLKSGASLDQLLAVIRERAGDPAITLVGHMPEFGLLAGSLATGERAPSAPLPSGKRGRLIELEAGAVVCVSVTQLHPEVIAEMEWMISPRELT